MKIIGPANAWADGACKCCQDDEFPILSLGEEEIEVGKVTKQENFTVADDFGISFPMDLDVKVKATLLGALFLIDFMYFETRMYQETTGDPNM